MSFQYVSWYDEPSVGGLEKSCADMLKADPNFGMYIGHAKQCKLSQYTKLKFINYANALNFLYF